MTKPTPTPTGKITALARACVQSLPSYMGPLVSGPADPSLIRLASNENPLGAGKAAQQAMQQAVAAGQASRYPDNNGAALRTAIAEQHRVQPEQVIIGNGSNEILEFSGKAFLQPGVSAVYSAYCFAVYPLMVLATGAEGVQAEAVNYGHDMDNMLAAVRPDTRLMLIANPNNPTATYLDGDKVRALLQQVPDEVVVLLDQAYGEYVQREDYPGFDELSQLHSALLITRSFSKIHGLAGLRVGYGIGSEEMIGLLERVRPPFNVNALSQVAARAALTDNEHLRRSLKVNGEGMQWLQQQLQQMANRGVAILGAEGNFITCRTPIGADVLGQGLLRRGVVVRSLAAYNMPEYFRVTVGLPEENRAFVQALQDELHAGA